MTLLRLGQGVGKWCWYGLAAALVALALLVSLVRTLLPELDSVRQELINTVEERYGIQLEIAQLGAGWEPSGPMLTVHGLRIAPQADQPHSLTIRTAQLQLNFWASLLNFSPYLERITIDGVELGLNLQDKDDEESSTRLEPLRELLLTQLGRLSIHNLTARILVGETALSPIYLASLNWKNLDGRHLGEGELYLDAARRQDETLTLALELNRHFDGHLFGRAYVKAAQLDIGDWLARQLMDNPLDYRGVLNLEAWASLDENGLRNATVQFGENALSWQHGDAQSLTLNSGLLQWYPAPSEGWFAGELVGQDLALASNGVDWPTLQLHLKHRNRDMSLWLNTLPAAGLEPLFGLIPGIGSERLSELLALDPSGEFGPIRLQRRDDQTQVEVPFEHLAWHSSGSLPGLDQISGVARWQGDWGVLSLPSQAVTLTWPDQLPQPVMLDQFALAAEWHANQQGGQLRLPELHLGNADLDAQLRAAVGFPKDAPARLQLYGDIELKQAGEAGRYFPRRAMGEGLSDYLANAIKRGHSDNVQLLWHGDLNAFPYGNHDGIFLAQFDMQALTFDFLQDWPAVEGALVEARFENARMDLWLRAGELGPISVEGAHVAIPSLSSKAVLEIQGSVLANGADAIEVMKDSFLADSVGKTLNTIRIEDRLPVALDMRFPLGSKVKEQPQLVQGRVAFWDTPVEVVPLTLMLEQTRGELRFNNSHIEVHGLQARIYNQPSELSIVGMPVDDQYAVDIDLATRWQMARIPNRLQSPLDPFLIGGAPLGGEIALRVGKHGVDYQAELRSNLVGLAIDLPAPLGKEVETVQNLKLAVTGNGEGAEVLASLADSVHFHGELNFAQGTGFQAYQIALGTQAARPILPGGYLEWLGDSIAIDQWEPLISSFASYDSPLPKQSRWFPALQQVEVRARDLSFYQLPLGNGLISGGPTSEGWVFQVDSDNLLGTATFGHDLKSEGIRLVADRLALISEEDDSTADEPIPAAPKAWIGNMPKLDLSINALSVNDLQLGQAQLRAQPEGDIYRIEQFNLYQGGHQLSLTGRWEPDQALSRSSFEGQLRSPDVGDLAKQLSMSQGIRDSDMTITFGLSWPGAPWQMELAELDGNVDYRLGKGHLAEVSDRGARLLSIFSLESLLRKLSLDFTDVFGSGLHFNRFGGTVQVQDGVVKTQDSVMDSVAGTVRVSGWTDLSSRELDYLIAFSPALTSSVPAVVFLSTGAWTIGLGAFAVSKMLEPVLEVITQVRYHLTGTLDDPILNEVDRTKREIALPEKPVTEAPNDAELEALKARILEALDESGDGTKSGQGETKDVVSPDPDDQPASTGAESEPVEPLAEPTSPAS
ncbi:YhdP family protein [Ferrimonas balearica]|uniref:YhdP family protein n=1 Tax=Ferrimonas balearica TaxID=44012 RepID=UPI001C9949F5|nr:YhdP family protein [Ferrimonas balearica]MBY5922491.1 TIGR02099 family protein [Ferrimonas balearica]MBY5995475.1 TIGR02099 family protein [Ferrimonas balearica]